MAQAGAAAEATFGQPGGDGTQQVLWVLAARQLRSGDGRAFGSIQHQQQALGADQLGRSGDQEIAKISLATQFMEPQPEIDKALMAGCGCANPECGASQPRRTYG